MHIKLRITKEQRSLVMKILTIIFFTIILYGFLSFVLLYELSINKFVSSSDFITLMVVGILTYVSYDIISGKKKINIVRKTPQNKKKHNTTNTTKTRKKQPRGTSICPQCHHLMIGDYCKRCRITWDLNEDKK
jgi:hypothetical protein